MAAPRVFISSTYYDLKHVRNDIGDFIRSLGYTPVMHDRGGVAYTQTDTIENSCYSELTTCDIVICIIGNHFGTQASTGDFSITMEELRTAIKNKKCFSFWTEPFLQPTIPFTIFDLCWV